MWKHHDSKKTCLFFLFRGKHPGQLTDLCLLIQLSLRIHTTYSNNINHFLIFSSGRCNNIEQYIIYNNYNVQLWGCVIVCVSVCTFPFCCIWTNCFTVCYCLLLDRFWYPCMLKDCALNNWAISTTSCKSWLSLTWEYTLHGWMKSIFFLPFRAKEKITTFLVYDGLLLP